MEASPKGFSLDAFIAVWQLGFLGVVTTREESWYDVWFFIFSVVVAVIMFNILIGVLAESYDMHQDNASIIFNREQAEMVLDTSLCLWPRTSFRPGLHWIQAIFCMECPGTDAMGPYLGVCLPKDRICSVSRLTNMKDHTAMQVETVKEAVEAVAAQTEGVAQQLKEVLGRLKQVELCLKDRSLSVSHGGCPVHESL
eukprot:TRINITY_DN68017_c0_g1_i1.p1 TRINITY_DN68017_c0_g1~~TRINITY_DN68017_c0_g1_i1.p1  ORF type:complete len:212 (-),score=17.24 TRINITY_DN68017_c0_g1_i1:227-817(-)